MSAVTAWPEKDAPGRYRITCSCGGWEFIGTVAAINYQSRKHDDSPWHNHIVMIRERVDA